MTDERHTAMFYLALGMVAGSLMEKDRRLALVLALRAGDINPVYVRMVRDKLAEALDAAGIDTEPTESKDAERYRRLRSCTWDASPLCVVVDPKLTVRLGSDCPSGAHLDMLVDCLKVPPV